jgi:hypothetical protein
MCTVHVSTFLKIINITVFVTLRHVPASIDCSTIVIALNFHEVCRNASVCFGVLMLHISKHCNCSSSSYLQCKTHQLLNVMHYLCLSISNRLQRRKHVPMLLMLHHGHHAKTHASEGQLTAKKLLLFSYSILHYSYFHTVYTIAIAMQYTPQRYSYLLYSTRYTVYLV